MKMSLREERAAWDEFHFEPYFSVLDPDDPETDGKWGVMDAECVFIARCPTKEIAGIVSRALDDYARKMEQVDVDAG